MQLLGVEPSASESEIKRSYLKLALQYHPDKNPDNPEAEEKFKRLTHVYAVLSDPERRADYDRHGEEASDDDIEIVEGEDDGSIYTVEELERMLGPEYTRDKLVSIVADMDFAVTKNASSTYSTDIIAAELKRAADNGISDIDFSRKQIDEIPVSIGLITKLSKLCLNECKIKVLPAERLTSLACLRIVELRGNELDRFPICFSLPSVDTLILDHNRISQVEENDLLHMTKLRVLSMFANKLTSFPSCVTTMKSMEKLDLECNAIKSVDFDSTHFPSHFQLGIDMKVKTPNSKASAPKTRAKPTSPKASSSSVGSPKRTPTPKSPNAKSPTAKKATSASKKKRASLTDADLGLDSDSADYAPPRAKRAKGRIEEDDDE
jgi:Leucine-rich repeat (LRR) protein